jgi:Tfp pilus assembly protein PilN
LGLVKSTQTTDEKETSLIVTKLNGLADVLSRDSDQISSIGLVDKILSLKNSNISLVSLSILEGEKGLRKITVSGISRSRDDLTRFNKNLISDGSFGDIDLPVSNLIKNSDLNFTMTMTHK